MQPLLHVDLGDQQVSIVDIPHEWELEYLGGSSLAARLLYDHLTKELDPLDPKAPLLFLNGPLSGTSGPAVGRFVVCGKSPQTQLWGESNCGGFWGPELRMAGFDGLWVTGKASKPVYLWIKDGQVEFRPANHLWGLDTYLTQVKIEADLNSGKPRIAVIGPAGEARLVFSLILTDHGRVAGRTGMGAVMGSKNLKAIAVQGSGRVPVVDMERYLPLRSEANRQLRADPVSNVLRELGSAAATDYFDYLGEMPKRYFRREIFDEATQISGANVKEKYLASISACHACVIACGRVVRLEDGVRRKGAEYETMVGFGPNLWLNDPVFAIRMGELCDRYGMDSISLSNTIGLVFHLYELGKINIEDVGGLDLHWGNSQAVEQLIHWTMKQEGIGLHLAQGARALGRYFNAEDEAIQVNGLEVAYHDPRGASGMALVYATSPIGASHNQSDYYLVDIGQAEASLGLEFYSRQGGEEKAANVARHQDWRTLANALVLCIFANVPPETVLELVNSAVGVHWRIKDMLRCGERGWNLKRLLNYRLGLRKENDRLPKALLIPYSDNTHGDAGYTPDFGPMLRAYYQARGWNVCTGLPNEDKLKQLNLTWAAPDPM